jgi:hypothetical protein
MKNLTATFHCLLLAALFNLPGEALAQRSERFGPYELHYNVVNTAFIEAPVAATYGITRGEDRAIVNVALRRHTGEGSSTVPMQLTGTVRDLLMRSQPLEFQEIREGTAVYYIAEFRFINEEWRSFDLEFSPEDAPRSYNFSFKQQLYRD